MEVGLDHFESKPPKSIETLTLVVEILKINNIFLKLKKIISQRNHAKILIIDS